MARSKLLNSAIGAAFMASVCASAPALALEPKQCLSMADMNSALKAEGQRTMIIGDREAINNPTGRIENASVSRWVNTVTSNDDGSAGYQLEGDLPRAQASNKVCVAAKLTDIKLFDARKASIPAAAMLGGQFDAVVRDNATKGTRPMVVATTVQPNGDGSYRTGLPFVMFGNVAGRSASITTRMPDGKPQFLVLMGNTDYTSAALAKFGTLVASVEPR